MKMFGLLAAAFTFTLVLAAANDAAAQCDSTSVNDRCICTMQVDPVCGLDGNTYGNSCHAACECVDIAYWGECDDKCTELCKGTDYAPVCGSDGETYGNACYAKCFQVKVEHDGACRPYVSPNPRG